jgi:hypothetical protein
MSCIQKNNSDDLCFVDLVIDAFKNTLKFLHF